MERGQDSGVGENINSGFISLEESTLDSLWRISMKWSNTQNAPLKVVKARVAKDSHKAIN